VVPAAIAEEHPEWLIEKALTFHEIPDLRLGCTPDYWLDVAHERHNLQVLSTSPHAWRETHGAAPIYKVLQTAAENLITGVPHGKLAVLVRSPDLPVHLFDVPRHPAAEQRILEAVATWWRAWDAGEIPAPASAEGLAEAFDDGSHKDLSDDEELPKLLESRETIKQRLTDMNSAVEVCDKRIKAKIGNARTAWCRGWSMKYPLIERAEYTVPASKYRRLTITRDEE
jgi:hypothetical protein